MSTIVLSQLRAVEAELASQVEELTSKLTAAKEQLSGIQTVIQMYSDDPSAAASESTAEKPEIAADATSAAKSDEVPAIEEPAEKKPKAEKTIRKTAAKKKDGRVASWQKYTRPGVKNESIPDAVRLILETQPDKDFKIAEVMDSLFKEGMPKTQYLKARNRISNVLSGGVRAGDWYKGQRGTYRMTTA